VPKFSLTDLAIRTVKAPETGSITLWDAVQPKLGVRISQGGTKNFIMLVGSGQRQSLGHFPDLSLKDARAIAAKKFAQRALARHLPTSISFADAFEQYATTHCDQRNKPATAHETKRVIRKYFIPKFGHRQIGEITSGDISEIIDRLLAKPAAANNTFAAIRGMFSWAYRREYVEVNPCSRLQMPSKVMSRDRVLTSKELAAVYKTALTFEYPFGTIIQLLILTGQRRGEIGALQWDWIDEMQETITLPAVLTKNSRQHTFPYGPMAAELLASTPQQGMYVFPASRDRTKDKPATIFAGWSKNKIAFDKALEDAGYNVAPWTMHDLRRTMATGLASFGTPIHVTERLLNHVSGTLGGLVSVYQRHAYMDEMRTAVKEWERRLQLIVRN